MEKWWILKILLVLVLIAAALPLAGYGYMRTAKFGALPSGDRLKKVAASPNYRDGEFRNVEPIPTMGIEKKGPVAALFNFVTAKKDRPKPAVPVPTVKTDLKELDRNDDTVIWLGHSSFYIQLAGRRILVDPVFSQNAAPVPYTNEAFLGANIYSPEDMPEIDILLITHDHWDHLDYPTVTALKDKVAKIVCPLGVGSHFERWGFPESAFTELDWNQALQPDDGLTIHALPARHFSDRTLTRNKTLWAAYALVSPERKIYLSGDSGYGSHFREAGEAFGGFDLVMLDSGQYNEDWRYVHMMPEDSVRAAEDLQARALLPAHTGKFSIAYHSWDDPFIRVARAAQESATPLLTPRIGEPLQLGAAQHHFTQWWETILAAKE